MGEKERRLQQQARMITGFQVENGLLRKIIGSLMMAQNVDEIVLERQSMMGAAPINVEMNMHTNDVMVTIVGWSSSADNAAGSPTTDEGTSDGEGGAGEG
jgi:hypothetical protein